MTHVILKFQSSEDVDTFVVESTFKVKRRWLHLDEMRVNLDKVEWFEIVEDA